MEKSDAAIAIEVRQAAAASTILEMIDAEFATIRQTRNDHE